MLLILKTKILLTIFIVSFTFFIQSFSDISNFKRISDKEFRYEFYTTFKKVKPDANKIYYWFKGGLIHNAQAGFSGELLNESFVKTYHSNQLAEQGNFKNGLKVGLWKIWYPNGVVESTQKWKKGLRSGDFCIYDEKGILIEKGSFKKNLKNGVWINFLKKDTIIYKNGSVELKKIKPLKAEKDKTIVNPQNTDNKPGFFKRLFSKEKSKQNLNGQSQ